MKSTRDCLGDGQTSEACEITRSGVLKCIQTSILATEGLPGGPRASNMAHLSKELAKII